VARTRSDTSRRAILDAAFALVGDVGYAKLTMEGIAARAGVGKQTIYRWWPSKGAVLFDAFLALSEDAEGVPALPDTGDLEADLKLVLRATVAELNDPRYDVPMRAMAAAIASDPALAAEYGIQGIPAVKAFRDGAIVSEFVGARPATFVKEWLAALVPPPELLALEAAERAVRAGDRAAAEPALRSLLAALAAQPELDRRLGARALAALARLLLGTGDAAAADPIVTALEERGDGQAGTLRQRVNFARDADRVGGVAAARAALARDPADRDARWALGAALASAGEIEAALAEFLELAPSKSKPRGADARAAMLALFETLGHDDPLTREYRRRLQIVT